MTTQNPIDTVLTNLADGWQMAGGVIKRLLKVIGGDVTITGSGSAAVVTFPAVTATLLSTASGEIVRPGGRLTLSSDAPVTPWDVNPTTIVYYTPYVSNQIALWDGTVWRLVTFTEVSLVLGTVTAGLPYDIFAYLNSGALAIEKLAWSSSSARATAISRQDGRLCKTGDKTRLYLGTILAVSTTQTADNSAFRGVYNYYNRVSRPLSVYEGTAHSYNGGARKWNNSDTSNLLTIMVGVVEEALLGRIMGNATGGAGIYAYTQVYLNGYAMGVTLIYNTVTGFAASDVLPTFPALGTNIMQCWELSNGGSYTSMNMSAQINM